VKRRDFITLLGGAAATWPLAARAQQPAMPVVGILAGVSAERYVPYVAAFRQGLADTGYVEGQNVAIEYRSADGQYDRMPVLVANLIQRRVTAIVVFGSTPAALAAKAATTTIPIVFLTGADTVKLGLVTSLNRPGGNLTGVTVLSVDADWCRSSSDRLPQGTHDTHIWLASHEAARRFGLRLHVLHASTERDFDTVFASLVQLRVEGLVIGPDVFFTSRTEQLAALTTRAPLRSRARQAPAPAKQSRHAEAQATFSRRRHQPRRPPLYAPAPAKLPRQPSSPNMLKLRRPSAAVATNREGHRSPRVRPWPPPGRPAGGRDRRSPKMWAPRVHAPQQRNSCSLPFCRTFRLKRFEPACGRTIGINLGKFAL
jgi:putative tryptophan/tyrosine transport system substrate-binding protein